MCQERLSDWTVRHKSLNLLDSFLVRLSRIHVPTTHEATQTKLFNICEEVVELSRNFKEVRNENPREMWTIFFFLYLFHLSDTNIEMCPEM